jgi:hypothetical protein
MLAIPAFFQDARRRWWPRAAALATALATALACAHADVGAGGARSQLRCEGVDAVIDTRQPETAAAACAGARDAVGFLHWLPRPAGETVLIELVQALPEGLRPDAVGCYAVRSRRLMVLEQALFLERGLWFGIPVSPRLWRAVVAHEVAHALVGCHLQGRPLPSAAHEYAAYVTMFATLDDATRQAALAAMPGLGFDHPAEINDVRYAFDPMKFGVESYRHWLRQPEAERERFMREVLIGAIVPDLSQ